MHNFKNTAAVTKIKALYGKKITKNQLKYLANCKSVSTIATYLKNKTCYSDILKEVDENQIHRGELEILIKKQNFNNYEKVSHYFNFDNESILKIIINEFEMLEVLKIISLIKINKSNEYITYLPGYLISKCNINLLQLAKAKNFSNLLNILKNTWYYEILKKFQPNNSDNDIIIDYTTCEYLIFKKFLKQTFKFIEQKMNNLEKFQLKKLINLEIECLDICNIFRKKIIFNLERSEIENNILTLNKNLNQNKFENLITSKNLEDFKFKLNIFLKKHNTNAKNFDVKNNYIENYFAKLKNHIFQHLLHLSDNVSVVFYIFHKLTQIEISNLIYTIEGVRYGLLPQKIQDLLIV